MTDVNMKVEAGACKFVIDIKATTEDMMIVQLDIKSECPAVRELADCLKEFNIYEAVLTPVNENPLFIKCGEHLEHAACPLPSALVKVCEAAGGLALKKDVSMKYA